jgi:hypothetical protein
MGLPNAQRSEQLGTNPVALTGSTVANDWTTDPSSPLFDPADSSALADLVTPHPNRSALHVSPSKTSDLAGSRPPSPSPSTGTRLPPSTVPKRFPPMPPIGLSDHDYSHLAKEAERRHDVHAKEAAKVGMYITSALKPDLPWEEKLRYFEHALHRHCNPPPYPDEETWLYYKELAALVKRYAGQEALRLASREDDFYAARLTMGQSRDKIEDEAEVFFSRLIGNGIDCPDFLTDDDFHMVKMIRDQWI